MEWAGPSGGQAPATRGGNRPRLPPSPGPPRRRRRSGPGSGAGCSRITVARASSTATPLAPSLAPRIGLPRLAGSGSWSAHGRVSQWAPSMTVGPGGPNRASDVRQGHRVGRRVRLRPESLERDRRAGAAEGLLEIDEAAIVPGRPGHAGTEGALLVQRTERPSHSGNPGRNRTPRPRSSPLPAGRG